MLLPTLNAHADIIKTFTIARFEKAGPLFRLRAEVTFINDSQLYIRETVIGPAKRKYSYHWQNQAGVLLIRWDNAPDWDVETFPHHKHLGEQQNVVPSYERTLQQVLVVIKDAIQN